MTSLLPATRIIDVWMQPSTHTFATHDMFEPLRRWGTSELKPVSPEQTVARLDEAGVRMGLLSAWSSPQGFLVTNEEVESIVRKYPTRFRGICSVSLRQPMKGVAEELPPNDRRYYPLYAECVQQDIPFCLQVGHTGPMMPSEPGRPIPYLDDVAREFPDLRIVSGHVGFPWTNEIISLAIKHPNVYIDTSAYVCKRLPQELVAYMSSSAKHKVMFGSNFPMLTPRRCLEGFTSLGLDDGCTEQFLFRNAERVFKLGTDLLPLPAKL